MFTLANSIAVAMYVIGFCESLLDMLTEVHGGEFGGIVDAGLNDVRIIGCGTVFVLLIIAIVFFYSNLSSRILVNIYYLFYLHIVTRVIGIYAEIKILDRKQEGVMCSKRIIY